MEGGIALGLTCAFKSEIQFSKGAADQSKFHDYELLNIAEMPPVEVHSSTATLSFPAVANALFAGTGTRYLI
jgi:isoquinoline 1-oxidoreductase beta subunit